ncbi:conserved hypothetical protein [Theileria orientalis strain Shintoku]|uniref:Uncharacterized protein n=1 Tax=Theileria orientalis strain Shintoku TaxID=869250 RepID=J4C3U2_THEOR|nr:conserved hypothetical protein [Theileria orientalis strain Shintoku]BAM41036.1 conserved hypothetical protein [Theileria orientalis strain Shintoku]|eukprot:XP_009691337.1 conserved hypothetical protein [Theileria orientalis strain Shintoku]
MDEYIDSLQNLLSEHGSATLSFISSKLSLTLDRSTELAHVFVDKNADYSVLYNVQYSVDGKNLKMCTVGHDELKDLSSKYKTLKSTVYAIKDNKYDMDKVFTQLFDNSFKLSQEEMRKSSENNTLYIPRPLSDQYMREPGVKNEMKPPQNSLVKTESNTHKTEFREKKEDEKHEPVNENIPKVKAEPKKCISETKRKTPTTKTVDKSDKVDQETKKLKVTHEPKVIQMELDHKLFDKEQLEEAEPSRSVGQPSKIKFVEKVSKENTYIENGYFVVEESEDYVEVVKDVKNNQEDKKQCSNGNKTESNVPKAVNGTNVKKTETAKSDAKKKLNQSSITYVQVM